MRDLLYRYGEIWLGDTEYVSLPGERPVPVCGVFREFRTKRQIELWQGEFGPRPPFSTGPDTLFVAYFACAEIGFFLALNWSIPERILDLYTEYRNRFNCLPTLVEQKLYEKGEEKPGRNSLVGALIQFGLSTIGVHKKKEMTSLINTGGPWTPDQKQKILDYCESDVEGLDRLLPAMLR
jgi:DNA polymerase-1